MKLAIEQYKHYRAKPGSKEISPKFRNDFWGYMKSCKLTGLYFVHQVIRIGDETKKMQEGTVAGIQPWALT